MEIPGTRKRFEKEGAFNENNELVHDKRTIAFAMPKGEFSSDTEEEQAPELKKRRMRQRQ